MYAGSRCERARARLHGRVRPADLGSRDEPCPRCRGHRTSTIAMSGVYERNLEEQVVGVAGRPTTSWPASVSSEAMPSRRSALSSATTMRSALARLTSAAHGRVPVRVADERWRANTASHRARQSLAILAGRNRAGRGLRGDARTRSARSARLGARRGHVGSQARSTAACAAFRPGGAATRRRSSRR